MKGVMRLLLHEIYGGSSKKKTETTYNPWQYYRNSSLSGSSNSSYKPYNPFTEFKGKKKDKKQDKPLSLVEQYIREENTPQNAKLLKSDSANSDAAKKSVLTIQQGLNLAGVKDKNGNLLKEDGKFGSKTQNNLNQFWKERFPNEPNYLGGIVQTNTTGLPYPAISNYYTTPTAKSWNFSSYPVTASHPKQEFDVTDDISIYKKELRAAKKRKEEDDARREADEQRKNANAKLPSNVAVSGSYASGYTHTL